MKRNYIILLLAVLGLVACQNGNRQQDEKILTVSIEPVRYFAEAIAGEHFKVVSMVPEGGNPETYDPTPQQMVKLNKSQAFLRIGYIGFEQVWMDKLTKNVPQMEVFDLSKGVQLLQGECHGHAHQGHETGVEPHIWNSIPNARVIADNVYQALCKLDEPNREYYRARTDSLMGVIGQLEMEVKAHLAGSQGAFLIYHPALSYLARDYGWEQISIEEGGKEPSPAHLQQIIRQCKEKKVKTVFIQKEFDSRNAEIIAREIGAEVVEINPLNYHWDAEIRHIAKVLGN